MRFSSTLLLPVFILASASISTHPAFANEPENTEPANQSIGLSDRMGTGTGNAEKIQVTETDRAFGAYQRGLYLTAFELALPQARKGDAAAQTLIGELYENGLGISRDPKEAASWYEIAAKSGNREAQFAYGIKLMKGEHVEKNLERGLELMKQAADAGHPVALFNYASHLVTERPTSATYRKALPLFEKAAEYRLADAYFALARIYSDGLATGINDTERGSIWLKKAATSGIDTAQIELGIKLLDGNPSPEDKTQAFSWFKAAANSGNVIAQNRLAYMLFEGIGAEKNRIEGAKWHILASRAGRKDFDLDQIMKAMTAEDRQKGLELANRWPSDT